ncbi:MAG: hypothetical protein AB4352_27460 [Hormoscilla sp.]
MISTEQFIYFVIGLAAGIGFWQLSKRYAPAGMRQINLIWFFVMLIWGASGWFFFRKLGVPILSDDLFYLPVPDWDVRLYQWTKWNFLYHRSWLFHSVLLPIGLLFASLWGMHRSSKRAWKWLRDGAIGLSVGMSAYLLWDTLHSMATYRRGFYIYGWNQSTSLVWSGLNLILGLGVPFLVIWRLNSRPRN